MAPVALGRVTQREGETYQQAVERYHAEFRQALKKNAAAKRASEDSAAVQAVISAPTDIAACVDPSCHDCAAKSPDAPRCPPAPSSASEKLTCPQVNSPETLAAVEVFLRNHPDRQANPGQLAARAAKILGMADEESSYNTLNITDMNYQGTKFKSKGRPEVFDKVLNGGGITINHQTNFGLLQMSADRFVIHPKNTLAAMNRVFGQQAASFTALNPVDDAAFFAACGTPKDLQTHAGFQGLGKKLSSAGGKFSVQGKSAATGSSLETIKYIGRLLAACPRLNIELAYNEFDHTYGGKKGGLEYFETRQVGAACKSEIEKLLNSPPTAGADAQALAGSSGAGDAGASTVADGSSEGGAPASLANNGGAPQGPAKPTKTEATPQAPTHPQKDLLDQVFEQDPITLGDRANTENQERAADLEKKKTLRDLALKRRDEVRSSDAAGLSEAGRQIGSEITRSKAQLGPLNDRIKSEKNDRERDKLRADYARVRSSISALESVRKELGDKKTYADRLGKAEGLLKDFAAHRHFDAWGAGSFNLLDTTDEKAKKDALVKIQSDMQDRTLPEADQSGARKKWDEMLAGQRKAKEQSWLNSETKKIVADFDKADSAVGYYKKSEGAQVNAPIDLTPKLPISQRILEIYRRRNPGNLYAPSETAIREILLEAQAAVRAGRVKSVIEYLEKPWSDPATNSD